MTKQKSYMIEAIPAEIRSLKANLNQLFRKWEICPSDTMDIIVSIDEALTNISIHGFKNITPSSKKIEVCITLNQRTLQVVINDFGREYDIENVPKPSIQDNLKGLRKGGFGVFLMKSLMDHIKLSRTHDKNTLQMSKTLEHSDKHMKLQMQTQ